MSPQELEHIDGIQRLTYSLISVTFDFSYTSSANCVSCKHCETNPAKLDDGPLLLYFVRRSRTEKAERLLLSPRETRGVEQVNKRNSMKVSNYDCTQTNVIVLELRALIRTR